MTTSNPLARSGKAFRRGTLAVLAAASFGAACAALAPAPAEAHVFVRRPYYPRYGVVAPRFHRPYVAPRFYRPYVVAPRFRPLYVPRYRAYEFDGRRYDRDDRRGFWRDGRFFTVR
jgi:hypothetical protein